VRNAGAVATDGSPITISDELPAGLSIQKVSLFVTRSFEADLGFYCTTTPLQCVFPAGLEPDEKLSMIVYVTVDPGVSGRVLNKASVSGGGAMPVSSPGVSGEENNIGGQLPGFGVSSFGFDVLGPDGVVDRRAGGHPYELTARIGLNTGFRRRVDNGLVGTTSVEDVKDVSIDLPAGFVGSALAAPQCTLAQLSSQQRCPRDTQVGELVTEPIALSSGVDSPIWNMVPERGVPAEFGFLDALKGGHILYASLVPTPQGYVLRTSSLGIAQISLTRVVVTFFGDPAAKDESGQAHIPFFTNPTSCTGEPLRAVLRMDSWQHPGRVDADGNPDLTDPNWKEAVGESPPVTGCNQLQFTPGLLVAPTTFQADTPSGLNGELTQPQSEDIGTLATATLRRLVVKLPPGLTANAAATDGLASCSIAQIGWVGPSPVSFTPTPPSCPEASKIGSLELTTPLISRTLKGSVYLAAQDENPFHSLLAAYVVVDDPTTGVLVKVASELLPDPTTGQLTVLVDESPNFPFNDLKLNIFGGPRATLATPTACGTYTTTSELLPWSAPDSAPAAASFAATPFDSFAIDTGCVGGFSPSFTALSANVQAGAFTPFTVSFSRSDEDQEMAGLSVSLPPGLLAKVAGVPRCSDADANAGTCPAGSQVGTVTAGAGVGPNPLFVKGTAYLTGPYKGAPYGLSTVIPAVAGPFNLGNVVVRQALYIDPHDAHATAVSDPFPTIIKGIPVRLRRVDVEVDRPGGFTFNPTNCDPMSVGGSLTSTQGATAQVSSRFQVTNCASLSFHPVFSVSTQARTSKRNGASLTVKSTFPKGPQANIRSVAVTLPKQLPSRLTTIQQACPQGTFALNPASCPAGSNIGIATATTPVLTNPLTGPVYLVSHGGAAFPDVVIVFQGEGITLDLTGSVNIKHGVTSSNFATVPDAPISSFQLTLPEGPHSALTAVLAPKARGNLCGQNLQMPFTITAQNGAILKQNTKIQVTGCPKAKKKAKTKKHHKSKRK
jgi:hypothetical protein